MHAADWLAIGLSTVFLAICSPATFADQPNIVMILSDDIGYNELGFSSALNGGHTNFETPNLDALAQQSVVGSRFYNTDSICAPSRAGLLTGQYQERYGFEQNTPASTAPISAYGTDGLTADQTTIAQRLKSLGYSTGAVGKWHLGYVDGLNLPEDKGFDDFYGFWGSDRQYFLDCCDAHSMRRGKTNIEATWQSEGDASQYDPVHGRYTTDAFGEESVNFINQHSQDGKPFFLYLALNAEHTPYAAKQADLDHFASITDPLKRTQAAIVYAMDRAVGNVLNALRADGIDQNTIVTFSNDNGGVYGLNDNSPYSLGKASQGEGGLRVPFTYRAPGLPHSVYDGPLTSLDLAPTLLAAAGGNPNNIQSDGYNVAPLLDGSQTTDPHGAIVWRSFSNWAVSKADWKLSGSPTLALYNVVNDPRESHEVSQLHPEIIADLIHELTFWEAKMGKPRWGAVPDNQFDGFVYQGGQGATAKWSDSNVWQQSGTTRSVSLGPLDAYANTTLEFAALSGGSYKATNDMTRVTGQTFMLNQLRFTGSFHGNASQTATIDGKPLLFVKSLDGRLPQIRQDAVSSGGPANFTFNVNCPLVLLDDLEITGGGTQPLVINGPISDYLDPRNVTKSGAGEIVLAGNNTFRGILNIVEGKVRIQGADASVASASAIVIGASGDLTLDGGKIDVGLIDNSAGGAFHFNGGSLSADQIVGDVLDDGATMSIAQIQGNFNNDSGTWAAGKSPKQKKIHGNFHQHNGIMQSLLRDAATDGFDQLTVDGSASLDGTLVIQTAPGFVASAGQTFSLLTASGGIQGTFRDVHSSTLSGVTWHIVYGPSSVVLAIDTGAVQLPGDYNGDGIVDSADYTVWRDTLGSTDQLAADGDGDHVVDANDYDVWQLHFGQTLTGSGAGAAQGTMSVPEPTAAFSLAFGGILLAFARRQR